MKPVIYWFRDDLRLDDNPGLKAAAQRGPVQPVFVWSPDEEGAWAPGAAARWWLHHSLASLTARLAARGLRLLILRGPAAAALVSAARSAGADAVYFSRRPEPAARAQEANAEEALRAAGIEARPFDSASLFPPASVVNLEGRPYRVFTPFWNRCGTFPPPDRPAGPLPAVRACTGRAPGLRLEALGLLPKIGWDAGLAESFKPGEEGARAALKSFLRRAQGYKTGRDFPSRPATSRLSAHLRFGEVSVHRIWEEAQGAADPAERGGFLSELGWRDFARHVLHHQPHTPERPLDPRFEGFGWQKDPAGLSAWKKGRTGYPIVDAGMRELWKTGWMHNRVRMVVASFLVKDLLIDWQEGARWFWDTLVDADLANNTLGWQWSAGCGADAAPFFRIFNPVEQGKRWDAGGDYVRRWVPELAKLDVRWLHAPWTAPAEALQAAGVRLGSDYPAPVVDHSEARARALDAFGARRVLAKGAGR